MGERGHHHRYCDADRRSWQDPEAILAGIDLKRGMIFIDVGCGYGFFALPAARIVGPSGKVMGIDIDREGLRAIDESAAKEDLRNIEVITGRGEESVPCKGCADVVFFGIVLHDFEDPIQVLSNARRMLKPNGKLVNLDWRKEDTGMGPPVSIRFDEQQASDMITRNGFRVNSVARSGAYHYIVTATIRR
jgi:ubiquinone/menaquinone biosynthesis C-methylase UbiE